MESVAFTYNGTDTVVATITGAEIGLVYDLGCRDPDSSLAIDTATGSTLVLTVSDVGGGSPGDRFRVAARRRRPLTNTVFVGDTIFQFGSSDEYGFTAVWDYDGSQIVSVTFVGDLAVDDYNVDIEDIPGGGSATPEAGTGASQTITDDPGVPQSLDYFEARLYSEAIGEDQPFKVRLFTPGVPGPGFLGNPDGPPPSVIVLERPTWKFIVSDLRTTRTLTVVTTLISDTTVERVLGEAWPAATTVPADDPRIRSIYEGDTFDEPFVAEGIRTLIGFRDTGTDPLWEVAYTGLILQVNDAVENGIPLSHLSAWDLRKYLEYLPVCKDDGTLPGKHGLTFTATKANEIARTLLTNLYAGSWGDLLTVLLNTADGVDEDCAELDITFQQGTSIADAWAQLEQTGAIDILLTPFYDPHAAPGIISVLNTYAEAGQERPAAIFGWDRSPRSLTGINRLEDGTKRANVVQYFDANGNPVTPFDDATSIAKYGPYVAQQAFPGQIEAAALGPLALLQKELRKNGKVVVGIDPTAQRAAQPIQGYDIGDRIRIEVSESLRKPVSGFARIYRVPIDIGQDAAEIVTSLGISADGLA